MELRAIARVRCGFPTKFGLPRQSGVNPHLRAEIVFEPEYRSEDALRGICEYSHLWIIWGFSVPEKRGFSATVRPPLLGGNERVGVFATRSPFRPNPLGLTVVRLDSVEKREGEGSVLCVSGADMMDGTVVYDIKPYIKYADSRPDAFGGITDRPDARSLEVVFPNELLEKLPAESRPALLESLKGDPRVAYHSDGDRVYGMFYEGFDVRFFVKDGVLTVVEVALAQAGL